METNDNGVESVLGRFVFRSSLNDGVVELGHVVGDGKRVSE